MNEIENSSVNITDVSTNTLQNNRGVVVFSREFLTEYPTEELLKAVFSNFFPVETETKMNGIIKMYGYSQHFKEISEGEVIPEYEIELISNENGIQFNKMIERES